MATFSHYQPKVYDEFFTKENTFKQLAPFIPKNKKIYMPFYSKYSKCNELLGKYIDNKIIYEDKDFFTYKITDGIICDNPPFAIKKKILNKLFEEDVPFMLILPINTIAYKYFRSYKNKIQLLIFNGRPSYSKCEPDGNVNHNLPPSTFDSAVFCYKINLEKDIIFLD